MTLQKKSYESDILLFKLIKQSNKEAFEVIFNKYYDDLIRLSFKYLQRIELAEEVIQEVFLYVWGNRKTIIIKVSLKSYLTKAVINKSINILKSSYSKFTSLKEDLQSFNNVQEIKNEQTTLKKEIRKAVLKLPERCRIIFILCKNFEYTYKEIAEILSISPNTVENQMVIAFKKIRKYLKNHYFILLPAISALL